MPASASAGARAASGGRIGAAIDLTFPVQELGAGPQTLQELVDGGIAFAETLARPSIRW